MCFLLPSIASSALDPACFLDFNVNGDCSAIHGANAQPQPQRPMHNEELAEEEEAGGADDGDDFYDDELDNSQAEEDPQEGDEEILTQTDVPFQQDANIGGRPFFEDDSDVDPAKFYYKEGVGLVSIDVPADEEAPQGGNYAASPAMSNGLRDLPCKAYCYS